MFQPGIIMTLRSLLTYIIPLSFVATNYNFTLLINPVMFTVASMALLIQYSGNINSVTSDIRQ